MRESLDRFSKIRLPKSLGQQASSSRPSKRLKTTKSKGKKPVHLSDDEMEYEQVEQPTSEADADADESDESEPQKQEKREKDENGARVCLFLIYIYILFTSSITNFSNFSDLLI